MNKPHVLLKTSKQNEGIVPMRYNYGFGKQDEEDDVEIEQTLDLDAIAENLRFHANIFRINRDVRRANRNEDLVIPKHIDYVRINFVGQFAVNDYFNAWYYKFGLEIVEVSNFGSSILFAVVSNLEDRFQNFLSSIDTLVENTRDKKDGDYSKLIHYIESFELLSNDEIINTDIEEGSLLILKIPDLAVNGESVALILNILLDYLNTNSIEYIYEEGNDIIEIFVSDQLDLEEIIGNFDIFLQVTSGRATIVRPDSFNLAQKEYGFVVDLLPDLPLVGIIDSGISYNTPLAPIIVVDETLNLTGSSVVDDNMHDGQGHGTAVAALVALGANAILSNYRGNYRPSCNLLSIKIIDGYSSFISISKTVALLKEVILKYPQIKVFTLTINFTRHKFFNENYSTYAYLLDKFAYENNCLFFISTGNNLGAVDKNNGYNLAHFNEESTNLCIPAESLNNMTIGACAESFRGGEFQGISNGREYPTMFSRKGHYNHDILRKKEKINKLLFKPDMVMAGGDYCLDRNNWLTFEGDASMLLLSADPTESFYQNVGTSFATPLSANIAVRLQKLYPSITASSIKALMLNHCTDQFVDSPEWAKSFLVGHGHMINDEALFSNENKITLIIEEQIDSGKFKIIPLKLPKYLVEDDLKKKNGILKITATLCFQFLPVKDNQLGYCPVHIAFGFFRNHSHGDILEKEKSIKSALKSSLPLWSQNARFKKKPIPYSNVQKQSFPINVNELIDEDGIFKIGVHCLTHPQLRPGEEGVYATNNKFSMVITIEETLKEENLTGKLYDEIVSINEIDVLGNLNQDLEAEA